MYYQEQLKKARENKIDLLAIDIANEVESVLPRLKEQKFEDACSIIEEAYLKSEDLSINQIAKALSKLIYKDKKNLSNITRRVLIDEACYM